MIPYPTSKHFLLLCCLLSGFCAPLLEAQSEAEPAESAQKMALFLRFSPSYSESGWNHYSNGDRIYGNYSPRSAGIFLAGEFNYFILPKLSVHAALENEFSHSRYNEVSQYYTNQFVPAAGLKFFYFQKGIVGCYVKAEAGYGFYSERYLDAANSGYATLRGGTFVLGAAGTGVNLRISPHSQLGAMLDLRYKTGEADVFLPTIDRVEFYDFKSKFQFVYAWYF